MGIFVVTATGWTRPSGRAQTSPPKDGGEGKVSCGSSSEEALRAHRERSEASR